MGEACGAWIPPWVAALGGNSPPHPGVAVGPGCILAFGPRGVLCPAAWVRLAGVLGPGLWAL